MRPGRAADHSPPSSAAVVEEYSYTSTHPLGHTGPVTGSLYLYIYFVDRKVNETWREVVLPTLRRINGRLSRYIVETE